MPKITLFNAETVGVDMKTNPLFLGGKKLHSAVNLAFDEGTLKTRPGFSYGPVIASGCFQGVGEYRPARGISSRAFGESGCSLFVVVDGTVYRDGCPAGSTPFACNGPVHIFQAESYLIFQSPETSTFWWDGESLTESPGMSESDWNDPSPQRTVIEHETPVANIPACEDIDGDGTYLLLFTVYDADTGDPLRGARVRVTRNNREHATGRTDHSGRWSCRVNKVRYAWRIAQDCYDSVEGSIKIRGNTEIVRALTPACEDCEWDIASATVTDNGSMTNVGQLVISNTGDIPLVVSEISLACGGSVVDPELPLTVEAGDSATISVSSVGCELAGTNLTVVTSCGSLTGVWEDTGGGDVCGIVTVPYLYYNTGASFQIHNTGTRVVEITAADIFGGADIEGASTGYYIGLTSVLLPFTLLPAEIAYVSRFDVFVDTAVTYSVTALCDGNELIDGGKIPSAG